MTWLGSMEHCPDPFGFISCAHLVKGPQNFFWKGEVIGWIFCHIISPSKRIGQIARWGGCKQCEASCWCKGQRLHCDKPAHCSTFPKPVRNKAKHLFHLEKPPVHSLFFYLNAKMSKLAYKYKLVATSSSSWSFSVAALQSSVTTKRTLIGSLNTKANWTCFSWDLGKMDE